MRRAIFILMLAFLASFSGQAQDNTVCNEVGQDKTITVCFSDDFEAVVRNQGMNWNYPKQQSAYEAITITTFDSILMVYRYRLDVSTVTHEMSHIQDFYNISGEKGAQIITTISDFVYETAQIAEADLFYRIGNREIDLVRKL